MSVRSSNQRKISLQSQSSLSLFLHYHLLTKLQQRIWQLDIRKSTINFTDQFVDVQESSHISLPPTRRQTLMTARNDDGRKVFRQQYLRFSASTLRLCAGRKVCKCAFGHEGSTILVPHLMVMSWRWLLSHRCSGEVMEIIYFITQYTILFTLLVSYAKHRIWEVTPNPF